MTVTEDDLEQGLQLEIFREDSKLPMCRVERVKVFRWAGLMIFHMCPLVHWVHL